MKDYSDNPIDIRLQNCTECGQEIDQDNDYYEYNAKDEIICESCHSSHWEGAVSVYEYDPEYENLSRIEYSYTLDKHRDYENYDPYDGPPQCIKSAGYKRIDGWRGYVDVEIADGFTCVAEGWTTGDYDDVKWKWDFNEFVNKVHEGELVPPVELFFIFAQTSNVFSTAAQLVVRTHQEDTFLNWLAQEAGLTKKQLQQALS